MMDVSTTTIDVLALGRKVLEKERDGLSLVLELLDERFEQAVQLVLEGRGRVGVSGIGKAGLIGSKIAATLSSTGTPAYVLHPAEAIHGDVGMVCAEDVFLVLSNSGESEELSRIIPVIKHIGCPVILITGRPRSRCAGLSDVVLNIGNQEEACPLGLAPSSSTTAMLALGDAVALTVSQLKGFAPEQYAARHPGGALGRSLLRVRQLMRTGSDCPLVIQNGTVGDYSQAVLAAPRRAGAAAIVDDDGRLVGFFTDGDLRRLLGKIDRPASARLAEHMTTKPKSIHVNMLVAEALKLMREFKIDELPVVDDGGRVVGLIDIQDLIARGFSLFDSD